MGIRPGRGMLRACAALIFSGLMRGRRDARAGGVRQSGSRAAPAAASASAATRALHALFDEEWEHDLRRGSDLGVEHRRPPVRHALGRREPRGAGAARGARPRGAREGLAHPARRALEGRRAQLRRLPLQVRDRRRRPAVPPLPLPAQPARRHPDRRRDRRRAPLHDRQELRGLERAPRRVPGRTWTRRSSCSPRASALAWCIRRSPCSASSRRSTRRSSPTRPRARSTRRTRRSTPQRRPPPTASASRATRSASSCRASFRRS